MWQRYPEVEESQESREGTAAHWAVAELFAGRAIAVGQVASNGITLTDEMMEGAELFYETVTAVAPASAVNVEQRLYAPSIHPNNWGTPDATWYNRDSQEVWVWDYKFGHAYVEEFKNWQLLNYAIAFFDSVGLDGYTNFELKVHMVVVQPRFYGRAGPVRPWRIVGSDLRPYRNMLRDAADNAHEPKAIATINPGCKHCSGRHACEVYQRTAAEAADMSLRSQPLDLPPTALGRELAMLRRAQSALEGRISGLEETIMAALHAGQPVPGWTIEHTGGRTIWARSDDEIGLLGDLYGVPLRKGTCITPKQAEKAGLPAELIAQYSVQKSGAAKLVPQESTLLRKIFTKRK